LTVIFKFEDRDILICKKAYLSDEADIRNLGQQIGGQMARVRFLDFKANHIKSDRIKVMENEFNLNDFFVHYEIVFQLTDLPNPKNPSKNEYIPLIKKFNTHNLIWHEPDNSNIEEKEEWILFPPEDNIEENNS
jgi:hypothetical protein